MKKSEIKEVKEILMNEVDCKFTVKGITEYDRKKDGSYGQVAKAFRTSGSLKKDGLVGAIYEDRPFSQGMNVTKWGPTCVSLFTYDMFGRKIVGKIRYEDIRFVASEQFECENPLKTLPGFLGTEKG